MQQLDDSITLNRTMLELKLVHFPPQPVIRPSLNRTMLELK